MIKGHKIYSTISKTNAMMNIEQLLLGIFLVILGGPNAINHPIVNKFNRFWKAGGTTQRPSDIEMSEFSIMVGRVVGFLMVIGGLIVIGIAIT
jgi:hypothetical protein